MLPHFLSTLFVVVHWTVVLALSTRVIMRRAPTGISLAWLTVIATAPGLGASLYLMFGERRLGRERRARIARNVGAVTEWRRALRERWTQPVDSAQRPVHSHAERMIGLPLMPGNRLELLDDADRIFDALVRDIDAARERCHLCFYIWHAEGRATEVLDALARAARRGVECRVLADGIGSKAFLRSDAAQALRDAGVEVVAALPVGLLRSLFVRRDLRNHRKIVVLDDRVAYTGSQNLVDPRCFKQSSGVGQWVDAMVRIEGPTAAVLDSVFALDWALDTGSAFEPPAPPRAGEGDNDPVDQVSVDQVSVGRVPVSQVPVSQVPVGQVPVGQVQVVPSGPDLDPEALHLLLLATIFSARESLVMTTPYFVPDESILAALLSVARRGVRVVLIVPARNDSLLVRYAGVAHYEDLLAAGVGIALFRGGLLHTKSAVVDGELAAIGSVNLDMRSLWLNAEISLAIRDAAFVKQLEALQASYLDRSERLDLEQWRRRPRLRQFLENTMRLLGPLL